MYLLDGDQDLFFDQTRPAQNGRIKVDGFEFEVAENINKDILPGVTLELKQAAPGKEINISVKEDLELISGKIEDFVKSTNGVLQFIQAQNNLNEKSDTTKTLGGDSLLRSIEGRIRNLIQSPLMGIPGSINRMSQLGINFQRNGTLQFDKKKFNAELAANPKDVGAFLAGDGFRIGFVPTLKREIANFIHQSYGPITNRKKGINDKINRINKNIESKEKNIQRREETLRRQFTNLEQTMSKLQSQGSAVAAIGAGMPTQKG